jgi:hypothetical protein
LVSVVMVLELFIHLRFDRWEVQGIHI